MTFLIPDSARECFISVTADPMQQFVGVGLVNDRIFGRNRAL